MSSEGDNGGGGAGNNTLYIIAGAAAGGFLAALIALTLLAIRRRNLPPSASVTQQAEKQEAAAAAKINGHNNSSTKVISSEIQFKEEDVEVSTLGDPVGGMMTTTEGGGEPDEQTASIENDYDYAKQYLKSQGIASLSSCERISSDNSMDIRSQYGNGSLVTSSFTASLRQETHEVSVPPGKLGMVLDTPNGGVPVVHAIKTDSVLHEQVQVGDRLVLVDGDDVTAMTAMQVSKLISLKADQHRVLVFVRDVSTDVENGGGGGGAENADPEIT